MRCSICGALFAHIRESELEDAAKYHKAHVDCNGHSRYWSVSKADIEESRRIIEAKRKWNAEADRNNQWAALSQEEQLALICAERQAACMDAERRLAQMQVNNHWLIDVIDQIHYTLCPEEQGAWQERAEQAVNAAVHIKEERDNMHHLLVREDICPSCGQNEASRYCQCREE